jgi:hypothetical protein
MRVITSFICALLLGGCVSKPSAHRTNEEVTKTAVAVANKAGYRLDEYQSPKVRFDSKEMRWSIYFDHKQPGFPGGYISIWVDDKTGEGTMLPSD